MTYNMPVTGLQAGLARSRPFIRYKKGKLLSSTSILITLAAAHSPLPSDSRQYRQQTPTFVAFAEFSLLVLFPKSCGVYPFLSDSGWIYSKLSPILGTPSGTTNAE